MEWQRCFHLVRPHLDEGGALPTPPGEVLVQSEDLGRWVRAQRLGRDKLTTVQQRMCEHILGIESATDDEKRKPHTSQAETWARHLAAAKQFHDREGHLRVPRKHTERTVIGAGDDGSGEDREERGLRLGAWIRNQRSRAATLTPQLWSSCPPSACAGHDSVLGQRCCHDRSPKVLVTDRPAEAGAGSGQVVFEGGDA